ncbi:GIY-YIG nuclease family protein [Massilia sp. CCM 8734]|uniref:GIY-YIG nuclease family protein n=1 Tax=Massilia sp. CCM 8734 TaxID=2609283 RepID=UPI00141DA3CE|nr:GIY-YIG nuclease family protein [Massilia sp. CCM 8734]NIA00760.1 hypothetical protein [Massilia sp. CCM 8734]
MKIETGRALSWAEIDLAPESPGVYAWYSRLTISKADVDSIIKKVNVAKGVSEALARAEVESALDRFIFNPYKETPYDVLLRGQLKPKYGGQVMHEPTKSDTLVNRLAENPERLTAIVDVLKLAAPGFTAPLYIGMAKNLRRRLRQHRNKIIELRDQRDTFPSDEPPDAGFANQVVARNFDPTNLFVHVCETKVDTSEYNDLENILNRINYPIFGRN